MDEGLHFLRLLGANTPPLDVGDRIRWKLNPNGEFDTKSYYNKLRDPPSIVFPWKGIWRVKAPRRVSFFIWCVAWNKILTGDTLILRKLVLVDWCIMCRHCGEMIDHLLLHCEMAHRLWCFALKSFGLAWVIPRSIPDLLFGWWNWLGKHSSQIWNLVHCASFGIFGMNGISELLRIWIIPLIRFLLLLVGLFFIGLGLGDSRLVTLSLLFFVLFLFCNFYCSFVLSRFLSVFCLFSLGLLCVFLTQAVY